MNWGNDTRWQHYLPQVEQRLNATNPRDPRKIYAFEIVNREACGVQIVEPKGLLISKTLALHDLFTFDLPLETRARMNFENVFHRYENDVSKHTVNLLRKLQAGERNLSEEVFHLFSAKLLNFFRNPYSIHKALNTLGGIADYAPTAPDLLVAFERILNGRKPHQTRLCKELGITDYEYAKWLRMLFMLFVRSGDGDLNILESTVKSMFTDNTHEVRVLVGSYTSAKCLLSDRAFTILSDKPCADTFAFNLCSSAFICYFFADIDKIAPANTPQGFLKHYKDALTRLPRQIQLDYLVDNLDVLATYNRNTIYQSCRHVYCSAMSPFII